MNTAKHWTLRNAVEAEREAPYTFYRPSEGVLAQLGPGHLVKVIFEFDPTTDGPSGERMWLEILSRAGDRFHGRLDNEPLHCPDLKLNDTVEFNVTHIIDTDIDDPKSHNMEPYFQRCFVSAAVMRQGRSVGRLYREPPDEPNDSGWRFLAGDESDDYLNDSKNVLYIAIGAVLNRDDSFISLLSSAPGSAYEREPNGRFAPVES